MLAQLSFRCKHYCACAVKLLTRLIGGLFSVLEAEEIDTMSSPSSLLYPYTTNTAAEDEDDVLLCSEENITEGGIYINQVFKTSFWSLNFHAHFQELEALGVGSILTNGEPDVVKLLNTTYELLQYYRKTLLSVENITTRYIKWMI